MREQMVSDAGLCLFVCHDGIQSVTGVFFAQARRKGFGLIVPASVIQGKGQFVQTFSHAAAASTRIRVRRSLEYFLERSEAVSSATMAPLLMTTILAYEVARQKWKWCLLCVRL